MNNNFDNNNNKDISSSSPFFSPSPSSPNNNNNNNWNEVNKEWLISEREIIISDNIIGKGAFGEVRLAKWRNINVAAKRLHSLIVEHESDLERLQFQNAEVVDLFREEMVTLSKLRHPNLVLFLGVGYNPRNKQPTTILTELLSDSLYDILEVHKIKLTLPEILDIALDIATGLDYLHSNNPQIIHRDISSKNILLGGKQAKIADLGQAKVFGNTALSRQTTMPGAMAYSAPEVLTGKYTSKIDIFSYGILLIQMCCNEYPRIDRRDEQQNIAIQKYEPLTYLLKSTISYQPNDRPTAAEICEILKEIRSNDRYYPPSRHLPPQCDIGIMARKWLDETVETRCGDIRIALEQTARRVTVEEQRWRDEADRVDKVLKDLKDMTLKYNSCQEIINKKDYEIEQLHLQIQLLKNENQQKINENQTLIIEKENINHLLNTTIKKSNDMEVMFNICTREIDTLKQEKEDLTKQFNRAKESEYSSKSNENHIKFQLEMQVEQCRDLEARLEQTLIRWKHEKEQVIEETKRCTRLRETCTELVEKDFRRKEEIDRLTSRLNMYNSLPLPDEIKARFRDNEKDIERLTNLSEDLRRDKYELELKYQELKTTYENSIEESESIKKNHQQILKQMSIKDERIHHLEEMVNELDEQVQYKVEQISRLETDKKSLIDITETIRDELQAAKDEVHAANVARRRAELDIVKNKGGHDGSKHFISSSSSHLHSHKKRHYRNHNNNQNNNNENNDQYNNDENNEKDSNYSNDSHDSDDSESDGGDIFNSNALPSPSSKLNHPSELEEIFDVDTRKKILNDQEKLRRYSINTRLKKVKDGELGTAESNAIKENTATRFHVYSAGNFNDLVKSATTTKDHLSKLQESQNIGDQEDFAERQRERDNAAKLRISMAIERGGIDKIIECLWENLDCEHTVWRGARAIRELFIKDDIVKQHCIEVKCEEILIAGLTAFPTVSLVQTQCLRALAALVFGSDIVRRHCGEKGALRRIVIALQLHTKDENVIIQACTALTNLCHNSSDNRGRYLEAGGTEPLLVAMAAHLETSVKVQRQACWAILTLAGSDEISRVILGQGADKHLLKSMMQWKNDASLQQFACWAISNLALSDEENKLKLKHSGVLEMCHIALEVHENNMEVVRQARHTISVLGSVPLNDESNLTRPKSKRKPTLLKPMKRDTSFSRTK